MSYHYCFETTRLTRSFTAFIYKQALEALLKEAGIKRSWTRKLDSSFSQLFIEEGENFCFHLKAWYNVSELLSLHKKEKQQLEQLFKKWHSDFEPLSGNLSFWDKFFIGKLPLKLLKQYPSKMGVLLEEFDEKIFYIDRDGFEYLDAHQLLNKLNQMEEYFLHVWSLAFLANAAVWKKELELLAYMEKQKIPDWESQKSLFEKVMNNPTSLEALKCHYPLLKLANMIRAQPRLRMLFSTETIPTILQTVRQNHLGLAEQIRSYIDRYGDRFVGDRELEKPSLRQNPAPLIESLVDLVKNPHREKEILESRESDENRLQSWLHCLPKRKHQHINKMLETIAFHLKNREKIYQRKAQVIGVYKDIFLHLGTHWNQKGRIQHPKEVFNYTFAEIQALE